MGHFLYFVPDATSAPVDLPRRVGLSDRIDAESFSRPAGDTEGPGGGRGVIISRGEHGLAYKPDVQTWSGPFGAYWIGLQNEDPPTPDTLARTPMIEGDPVKLLDGNEWVCPKAIMAPQRLTISGNNVVRTPVDGATRLFELADRWAPYICGCKDDGNAEWIDIARAVAECLSVNYRLSPDPSQEMSLLGIAATSNVGDVLLALCDGEFLHRAIIEGEHAKKNERLAI